MSVARLVGHCRKVGIVFPSSEIYGGFAGFFDYGPLGTLMKNNIRAAWWKNFVTRRSDKVTSLN